MKLKIKTRRENNSVVESKKIRKNDEVVIESKGKLLTRELFGKFPEWKSKKSAQELKDDARNGWR